jgi:hypothetical protein
MDTDRTETEQFSHGVRGSTRTDTERLPHAEAQSTQ